MERRIAEVLCSRFAYIRVRDDLKRIFQPVVMEVNQAIAAQILSTRVNRRAVNRHDLTSIKVNLPAMPFPADFIPVSDLLNTQCKGYLSGRRVWCKQTPARIC
jgi:hypothetical protein